MCQEKLKPLQVGRNIISWVNTCCRSRVAYEVRTQRKSDVLAFMSWGVGERGTGGNIGPTATRPSLLSLSSIDKITVSTNDCNNNKQLLDEVEQNIVFCQWRADQLLADAEGRGK